jgi:hypothetical protein
VREVFARYVSGSSMRTIARNLNDRRVGTQRGGPWTGRTIADMLRNPAYIAHAWDDHKGEARELLAMKWEAIVERDVWDRAQVLREGQRARSYGNGGGGRAPKYLLSGFVVCGACDKTLCHVPRRRLPALYSCPISHRDGKRVCPGGGISQPIAEGEVFDLWWWIVSFAELKAAPRVRTTGADLDRRQARIERRIENVWNLVAERGVSAASQRKLDELEAEKVALEAERAVLGARSVEQEQRAKAKVWLRAHDPANVWDACNTDERRDLLRAVFKRIEMIPGTSPKQLHFDVHDEWDTPKLEKVLRKRERAWESVREQARHSGVSLNRAEVQEMARAAQGDLTIKRAVERVK